MKRFVEIPWTEVAPFAREKRVESDGPVLRLVQFDPGFKEYDWCQRSHYGYVLQGSLAIDFDSSVVTYSAGDYLAIPGGGHGRHRAVVSETVTLFLVEPAAGGGS